MKELENIVADVQFEESIAIHTRSEAPKARGGKFVKQTEALKMTTLGADGKPPGAVALGGEI